MSQGFFPLAPDLELHVTWSSRMTDMLHNRYGDDLCLKSETDEAVLDSDYGRWCRSKAAVYAQVQRILRVTASLPVVGDHLQQNGSGLETLRIDNRLFFTIDDSEPILVVYEVSSDELEDWEDHLSQQLEADAEEVSS